MAEASNTPVETAKYSVLLAVLAAETARLEIGERRLDAPSGAVVQWGQVTGRVGHRDDPWLCMAGLIDDADVGTNAPMGEHDIGQVGLLSVTCSARVVLWPSATTRRLDFTRSRYPPQPFVIANVIRLGVP